MAMLEKKDIQNFIRQFEKKKESKQTEKLVLVAISSALAGALLGVLFAPDKGKNTRKKLSKGTNGYFKDIKKNSEDLGQKLKEGTDSILSKTDKAFKNIKQDVEDYSELTFQELYDMAKDLKVKGYSQMNKSELIQALED